MEDSKASVLSYGRQSEIPGIELTDGSHIKSSAGFAYPLYL